MGIKFIVETRKGKGLGHFYRALAVAQELKKRGYKVGFVGTESNSFPLNVEIADENQEWQLTVIDSITMSEEEIAALPAEKKVLFDDLGYRKPERTLVINVSGVRKWAMRSKTEFGGFDFVLYALPPENPSKNFKTVKKKAVISFGGEGNPRLVERVFWSLSSLDLTLFPFGTGKRLPYTLKPSEFLGALSVSHCAVLNGGTSLYSALHAGCYPFSIPQNPHQFTRALELHKLGFSVLTTPREVVKTFMNTDWGEIERRLQKAKGVFNGNSIKNVAEVVEEVYKR
jgi:spore coat polysaccharide biosynthesis predicted glycosyltransferase SpsG